MMLRLDCETVRKAYTKILKKKGRSCRVRYIVNMSAAIADEIPTFVIELRTQLIKRNKSIMETVTISRHLI